MTDAPTLKPCPFCGGEATYRVDHTTEHVDSISCRQCDFYMSDQGIVQGSVRDTWNRRALPLPDDAEMVERGAKALARLYKLEDFAPFYEDAKAVLSAMRGEP